MENNERIEKQIKAEQQKISYDVRDLTIEYYVNKYLKDEEIDQNDLYVPDYQREFIWQDKRQSRFIESIILGLPVPFIFVAEIEDSGRLEIVDGSQRVRTLAAFLKDKLTLVGLKKLKALNGVKFSQLKPSRQRLIINTSIKMVILSSRANEDVRNDMFDRINTSSVPLVPMETRRGVYKGEFTNLVIKCAEKESFKKLLPLWKNNLNRRKEEELALRFFAFSELHPTFKLGRLNVDKDGVTIFLDSYLKIKNDNVTTEDLREKEIEFDRMVQFVSEYFPGRGFAKRKNAKGVSSPYFEAIAVGVNLALREKPDLRVGNLEWSTIEKKGNNEFFRVLPTRYHTHKASRIRSRIEFVKSKLLENGTN